MAIQPSLYVTRVGRSNFAQIMKLQGGKEFKPKPVIFSVWATLDSGINIGVCLSIIGLFFGNSVLIREGN